MFSPTTIGGTRAAVQLGTSLAECKDKRFVRILTRQLGNFYRNCKIMATLPKSQRETALWAYYREVKARSEGIIIGNNSYVVSPVVPLRDRFLVNNISFSLYDSVVKAHVRETLRHMEQVDKNPAMLYKNYPKELEIKAVSFQQELKAKLDEEIKNWENG